MMDIRAFALNLLKSSPNLRNNQQAQQYIQLIESGDSVRGAQVAQNLCNTYGISKEQAVQNAKNFFNL